MKKWDSVYIWYFDQHLKCAAPKPWSKNKTGESLVKSYHWCNHWNTWGAWRGTLPLQQKKNNGFCHHFVLPKKSCFFFCWLAILCNHYIACFLLLVSHLRLSQRRNDPVVGWLYLFVVITLYQQQPIGSTNRISFLHFQHKRRVKTCNLSHKFQPSHDCIDPLSLAVTRLRFGDQHTSVRIYKLFQCHS